MSPAETEGTSLGRRRADAKIRDEYERTGRIQAALSLREQDAPSGLRDDVALFDEAIARLRRERHHRVPYLVTPAIERVAQDPNVLGVVGAILGEQERCVMWGPNIQRHVPNQAGRWHVDIESWHWPTITVVIGLDGCTTENSTRCLPGTHRLPRQPPTTDDDRLVLRAARSRGADCERVERFEGFGNGRFYVFNARCWHRGARTASHDRTALFLHFQRAREPRIPYMKDYRHGTWFDSPAAYTTVGPAEGDAGLTNESMYPRPWRKLYGWLGLLGWRR